MLLLLGGFVVLTLASCNKAKLPQGQEDLTGAGEKARQFADPKKSAHWESNTPAHAAVLAAVPINVVVDFNFDLVKPSAITVSANGQDWGVGETVIDSNKLAMRRSLDQNAPDGLYTVSYEACWPDGTCHDGSFQFAIDRQSGQSYLNLLDKDEVTVRLAQIAFEPKNLRIKQGTKVVWINDDDVEHYVNTDSHPSHTYFLTQNSEVLKNGDSYSLTFEKRGVYPYHCSAHANSMVGTIIVE